MEAKPGHAAHDPGRRLSRREARFCGRALFWLACSAGAWGCGLARHCVVYEKVTVQKQGLPACALTCRPFL